VRASVKKTEDIFSKGYESTCEILHFKNLSQSFLKIKSSTAFCRCLLQTAT